jgi:hypothetical protein
MAAIQLHSVLLLLVAVVVVQQELTPLGLVAPAAA